MVKKNAEKELPGNLTIALAAANIAEALSSTPDIDINDTDTRTMKSAEILQGEDFKQYDWSAPEISEKLDDYLAKKMNFQVTVQKKETKAGKKEKSSGKMVAGDTHVTESAKAGKFISPEEWDLAAAKNVTMTPQKDNTVIVKKKKGGRGKDNIGWSCPDGSEAYYKKISKEEYKVGCKVDEGK